MKANRSRSAATADPCHRKSKACSAVRTDVLDPCGSLLRRGSMTTVELAATRCMHAGGGRRQYPSPAHPHTRVPPSGHSASMRVRPGVGATHPSSTAAHWHAWPLKAPIIARSPPKFRPRQGHAVHPQRAVPASTHRCNATPGLSDRRPTRNAQPQPETSQTARLRCATQPSASSPFSPASPSSRNRLLSTWSRHTPFNCR